MRPHLVEVPAVGGDRVARLRNAPPANNRVSHEDLDRVVDYRRHCGDGVLRRVEGHRASLPRSDDDASVVEFEQRGRDLGRSHAAIA